MSTHLRRQIAAQHAALVSSGRRYHQATARLAEVYQVSTVAILHAVGSVR